MRYNEIILEANYRSKFDTSKYYRTQAEFDNAVKKAFGISGPNKVGSAKAGGAQYIVNPKGILGYKVPNTDSPEGFVWYMVKEPFVPAAKTQSTPAPKEPAKAPVAAPKAAPAPNAVDPKEALGSLLRYVAGIKDRSMWGNYETQGPEESYGEEWYAGIRDWGHWQLPAEADPSDEEYQDYDWEELSDESGAKMNSIVDEFAKRYPTVQFRWTTGEKNWIEFYAKAK